MDDIEDVPDSFICPLTHTIMTDPVVDHEGNSYDREAIEGWLQLNLTSPITRNHLTYDQLSPNRALKNVIDAYLQAKSSSGNLNLSSSAAMAAEMAGGGMVNDENAVPEPIKLGEVHLEAKTVRIPDKTYVLVSIIPPLGVVRTPTDICCVIDTSLSMNEEASVKTDTGVTETHGLSLLDIVRHAVDTIIEAMLPQDRLCLISFSNSASVVLSLTKMDGTGKKKAHGELKKMRPTGATNFWDGLHKGLEVLRENSAPGRLANLVILTDGCPTISPPRGEAPTFKRYKDSHKDDFPCAVTTFGFGYSLNSDLLKEVAIIGDGMYSFIPDSSLVGTVFVNSITNLLCSFAKNAKLSITPGAGTRIEKIPGGFSSVKDKDTQILLLSSLQYDQKKDVLLQVSNSDSPQLTIKLQYNVFNESQVVEKTILVSDLSRMEDVPDFEYVQCRFEVIDAIREIITKMNNPKTSLQAPETLANLITALEKASDPRVQALLQDATGQITEAISKEEWWKRWGKHFLPSLMGAHLLQQCNNFKDPGIQSYGGPLFEAIRDEVESIFTKLPPPKPTRAQERSAAPLQSMNTYYNQHGGCFDGNCQALMANKLNKLVKDVKKGDKVMTPNGGTAEVTCVLKMNCPSKSTTLVQMEGGLLISAYHPIRINQTWTFPCDVTPAQVLPCEAVYSFLLNKESEHVMLINGMQCVTLAHNKQEEVVRHAFFGSDVIAEQMMKMKGWEEGVIEFEDVEKCFVRDERTKLVVGFNVGSGVSTPAM